MTKISNNKVLIAAVGVLAVLLAGVTVWLLSVKQTNYELVQEFELEKEDLEGQYAQFSQQYDELKMTVSNDSLSVLLEQEQMKTQRLLEELRTVKSSNASEIRRLRKELASLRKVMMSYINQIDSLNRLTAHQQEIIKDVTRKYDAASRRISNLSEEKEKLKGQVTLAAQLDATNISVLAANKRGRKARKVKDIVKFPLPSTAYWNFPAERSPSAAPAAVTKREPLPKITAKQSTKPPFCG